MIFKIRIYLTDGFANIKNLAKENIITKFSKKSFEVQILDLDKKNYKFGCNNLSKEIEPDGSYVKQTNSGMTIFLKKAKSSDHWDSLEQKKSLLGESEKPAGLSSDPNAGLMEMMKEMYQNGDPEMKRVIAESWTKAQSGDMGNFK
jgi:calcyclin binding protein